MTITATMVKELRDTSGAGMMDAKKALTETGGDMEAAIDWLRTKGLAKAAKKSGRTAAEGLVGVAVKGGVGVAVEVNSETDFVARNSDFQAIVRAIAEVATGCADIEALRGAPLDDKTVQEAVTDKIVTIGENLHLRRMASVEGDTVAAYVHNSVGENLGKIGVLVALEGDAPADVLEPLGKQLAMHIAAAFPLALSADDIDPALLERERAIAAEKAAESGKPAEIVAKMVDGAVAKFAKEQALLSQLFVMDNKTPIADVVAKAAKDAGKSISLKSYVRFQLGEGIEKEVSDFAAEVAAAAGA